MTGSKLTSISINWTLHNSVIMSRVILFSMLGSTLSSTQTPEITLNDVYAQVGRILFKWSHFERELNESANWLEAHSSDNSNKSTHHGAFQVFARWKNLNEPGMEQDVRHKSAVEKLDAIFIEVLQVRNALCHGQISATGIPSRNEAFVETELSGEKTVYHCSDLVATIDEIHCVQMVLMDISSLVP